MPWTNTIVVGYDGTRPAEFALARAVELAKTFGCRLVVADVVVPEPLQATPGAFGLTPYYEHTVEYGLRTDQKQWQRHRARIESFLAETAVPHEFAGVLGEPAGEIVDVAEHHRADLIVVGTREPGFLERVLGGSVSQGVARRAHCDVLIIHPPEEADA